MYLWEWNNKYDYSFDYIFDYSRDYEIRSIKIFEIGCYACESKDLIN